MVWIKAFVAGFLATMVFHQGLLGLMHLGGMVPMAPFNLEPVPPLEVPSVLSLAFFGGLWGLPAWALMAGRGRTGYWLVAVVFGAIFPTAVAMLVVFPLKDMAVTLTHWIGGFMLNGAWGLGVGAFMVLMGARRHSQVER